MTASNNELARHYRQQMKERAAAAAGTAAAADSGKVESVLTKATSHCEHNDVDLAINELCGHFERRSAKYTAMDQVAMQFLIELALNLERVRKLGPPLRQYHSTNRDAALDFFFNSLRARFALGESTTTNNNTATNNNRDNQLLATLLGEESAAKHGVMTKNSCKKNVNDAIEVLLDGRVFGITHIDAFIKAMDGLLSIVEENKLKYEVLGIMRGFGSVVGDVCRDKEDRYFESRINCLRKAPREILLRGFRVLQVAATVQNWEVVGRMLNDAARLRTQIDDAIVSINKLLQRANLAQIERFITPDASRFYLIASDIFLKSRGWIFHAHLLHTFSKFDHSPEINNRAVLATLCVSRGDDEAATRNPVFRDDETSMMARAARQLLLDAVPTREALLEATKPILPRASADIQALYHLVTGGDHKLVQDLSGAYKYLQTLRGSGGSETNLYTPYLEALERALLEEFVTQYFETNPVLPFTVFDQIPLLAPDQNDLYAIVASRGAIVDIANKQAVFNAKELQLQRLLANLADNAAQAESSQHTIAKRTPLTLSGLELEQERTRLQAHISLQIKHNEKENERQLSLVQKHREGLRKVVEKKEAALREKHSAALDKRKKRLLDRLNLEIARGRQRNVVKKLSELYKIPISDSIALLPATQFFEKLAQTASHELAEAATAQKSEMLDAYYEEKQTRRADVVARRELETKNAEKLRREAEERVANIKRQHHEDWQRNVERKHRFELFAQHAQQYEARMGTRLKPKTTKAESQQANLDDFRRGLLDD